MNESFLQSASDDFTLILWMLARLVIFTMMLERVLYFIFDYTLWRDKIKDKGIRAPIALAAAWVACWYFGFDVVYPVLDPSAGPTPFGIFITAGIMAGGSQGAMLLFQNILNFSREAREEMDKVKKEQRAAALSQAKLAQAQAKKQLQDMT